MLCSILAAAVVFDGWQGRQFREYRLLVGVGRRRVGPVTGGGRLNQYGRVQETSQALRRPAARRFIGDIPAVREGIRHVHHAHGNSADFGSELCDVFGVSSAGLVMIGPNRHPPAFHGVPVGFGGGRRAAGAGYGDMIGK